jgi:hypothetical protein
MKILGPIPLRRDLGEVEVRGEQSFKGTGDFQFQL